MNIGGGQIRGALFNFFVVKKCPFLHLPEAVLSCYNNPCDIHTKTPKVNDNKTQAY